jgi:hypothetical protein
MDKTYYQIITECQNDPYFSNIISVLKQNDSYVDKDSKEMVEISYRERKKPSEEYFRLAYSISCLKKDVKTAIQEYKLSIQTK